MARATIRRILHIIVNHQAGAEDDGCDRLDAIFAALSNPDRRRIVDLLTLQPASIQQVAAHIGMSLSAIHRHLAVLEDAGLIQRRKSGRVNFLAVRRSGLRDVQAWAQQYETSWGTDDESLENYVATMERDDDRHPDRD